MTQPYGPRFWAAYVANISLMVAVSLLFRYADFVDYLGGTERQLGWITGLGMVGAIAARSLQGLAIDRLGTARVWIASLVLLVGCLLAHLLLSSLASPWIYLLRLAYTISLAGAFGASITYVSLRAPNDRMGEMIGMLGSSGFLGMAVGPLLGDLIFAGVEGRPAMVRLFLSAASASGVSLVCAVLATWGDAPRHVPGMHPDANPFRAIARAIRAYHPGWTLLVSFAMGVGIGLPGTFLSTFAADRGIAGLGWFFLPYAAIAFVVRIFTRKLADRWGTRPTILLGLSCLGVSMLAYLCVQSAQTLLIPASLAGLAHAFLFPAAVAEGNQTFPVEQRGLATNLTLSLFDSGLLIGQPLFGWTVEACRASHIDGYFVAFAIVAGSLLLVTGLYAWRKPRGMPTASLP